MDAPSLGLPREALPQLDITEFLDILEESGIEFWEDRMDPNFFVGTQQASSYSREKIDSLKGTWTDTHSPVLCTSELQIIDGHHRWVAASELDSQLNVIIIDIPFAELFDLVKKAGLK